MVKEIRIGPTDGLNFKNEIGNLPLIVKIYHPNCGHCIKLKPEWDILVNKLKNDYLGNIGIVDLHADALGNIKSDGLNNIQGYPTIRIIKNNKLFNEYNGPRTSKEMLNYTLEH